MNLILLHDDDFISERRVVLKGRRYQHIKEYFGIKPKQRLVVGKLNANCGTGEVLSLTDKSLEMEVTLDKKPPPPLPLTLIMALHRPLMLKRAFFTASSMGVKKIYLIHSNRVEKSFWKSHSLKTDEINRQLYLGLEQARDTMMPAVYLKNKFKPFVQDELPSLIKGTTALVAHPQSSDPCPSGVHGPVTLMIGPEGGFIPYEIESLNGVGFRCVHLGERILRVETALPALIAHIMKII